MSFVDDDIRRKRAEQAARVMPLIGPLLDAWEQLPNDVRSDIELAHPPFLWAIEKIVAATEGGG